MASKALSDQVAAKWQYSFDRLNRGVSGISGLMEFSTVRNLCLGTGEVLLFNLGTAILLFVSRPGRLLLMLCDRGSSARLRKTLVSTFTLCDAWRVQWLTFCDYAAWADTPEVRSAFDVLMQCRMLTMLIESFIGVFLDSHHSYRA